MTRKVLILSSREDVHAARVDGYLQELGVESLFWRYEPFVHDCELDFAVANSHGQFKLNISSAPGNTDIFSFDAVWLRRPVPVQSKKFFQPWVAALVEVESRAALMGMLYALPCLWVNFPARDTAASLKLFQLQVAKNVGLAIPETIVTNEPSIGRSFYEKFKGQVIYKLITEISNFYLPAYEFPHGIPTLPVRDVDLQHFGQIRHAPHLFQEKIDKQSDIRVTVIGKKVFAYYIESQEGRGKLDWRTDYTVPMKAWDLGDEMSDKCLKLLTALGLNYGAFDFCLDKNGQYVFLEVNPSGQYLWLEERTNEHILSKEMALLLSGKSEPLVSYEYAAFGNRAH